MGKTRKKTFPQPPVRFHSKLEKDLGKWSNLNLEANRKGIYLQAPKNEPKLNERQTKELEKLKANLAKRIVC